MLWIIFLISSSPALAIMGDSIPTAKIATVQKSIYPLPPIKRSRLYDKLWGKHYRDLYYTPITVNSTSLRNFFGNAKVTSLANDFYGLYLKNSAGHNYLLKPIGGTSTFLKSNFFQEMYNKKDFEDTYLDQFIGDAYTIINPYTFLASDYMARVAGLKTSDPSLYYIPPRTTTDTIIDGSDIQDRLVSICLLPDTVLPSGVITSSNLIHRMQTSKAHRVNQTMYIRERLFDMLIGDWNKTPENWMWIVHPNKHDTVYEPLVIDRSHAFSKIDGLLTGPMLGVLDLGFITDYTGHIKDVKKANQLGFTTDVALTPESKANDWVKQAEYLQRTLTDDVIDDAFARLPKEIQGTETNGIKLKLKKRRDQLVVTARQYYKDLQFNPVIIGTAADDTFIVDKLSSDTVRVRIYNETGTEPVFSQNYTKRETKEIWIYGLEGNNTFEVKDDFKSRIPLYLLGGEGQNNYDISAKSKVKIFGYKSQKAALDSIEDAKVIITDNESVHNYDYHKTSYKELSFSPWGIYDSDWGLSLGSFVTYTRYGLKRFPFSYQHRIGYNYLRGFMYKGIFPMYDGRKSIYLDAFVGSPVNFSNFFGFGNNTEDFKGSPKKYNRVKISQYSISPSIQYTLGQNQKLIFATGFEHYRIRNTTDRFINKYYEGDDTLFDSKNFVDFNVSYEVDKKLSDFVPVFTASLTGGWKLNVGDFGRNYPYSEANMSFNFCFSDRFTLATQMKGRVLFNDKYEFYQSASTELRGYRDSRFIGRQSYYQYSDLRVDMGRIKNPFTPLKYGLFAGFDFGRVWYPPESSKKWHASYGGGAWVTIINTITTKYSWFASGDDFRFMFGLGMGF